MSQRKTVIVVAPSMSSFIKSDIAILSKEFHVKVNLYDWRKKYLTPFYLLHQVFFFLFHIRRVDKILVEFGGYWSLIPAVFGKTFKVPVFIVLHGTDCASIPTINYGSLRKLGLRYFCKESYKLATALLPVSSSLVSVKNIYYSDDKQSYQGYKHFFPNVITHYQIISNGTDENFWRRLEGIHKERNSFIAVFSGNQFFLKGGDLIVSLAERFPDCKFHIAGMDKPVDLAPIPGNLYFLGRLSKEELREYYNKCEFHLQLSIFEGFGLALCEAMLCECIPIGSSVNIIPEIIGDTGFVLEKKDQGLLVDIIEKALSIDYKNEWGKRARSRVIKRYNMHNRETNLLSVINSFR